VRRGDNTEQDIGFNSLNTLDTTALTNFVVPANVQALYSSSMNFDGVDDYVAYNTGSSSSNHFGACTITSRVIFTDLSVPVVIHALGAAAYRLYYNTTGTQMNLNANTATAFIPSIGILYTFEVDYNASGDATAFRVNGATQWTGTSLAGITSGGTNFSIGARESASVYGLFHRGVITQVTVTGSNGFTWLGNGNTNANWEDQVGSKDATVNGSPALFTGQGMNGFVTTWYDQSGNGFNAIRATASEQPTIFLNGSTLLGSNGLPAISFDGTNDHFIASITGFQSITNLSAFHVFQTPVAASANTTTVVPWGFGQTGSTNRAISWGTQTGLLTGETMTLIFEAGAGGGRLGSSTYSRAANTPHLFTNFHLSSGTEAFANGSSVTLDLANAITTSTPSAPSNTGYVTNNDVYINGYLSASVNVGPACLHQELIFYPQDQRASRSLIESNMMTFWKVV
jgi:hypothetical protein